MRLDEDHKISEALTVTAIWTNEKNPQLEKVEVTTWHGSQGITATINEKDLIETIAVLALIALSADTQKGVKRRNR